MATGGGEVSKSDLQLVLVMVQLAVLAADLVDDLDGVGDNDGLLHLQGALRVEHHGQVRKTAPQVCILELHCLHHLWQAEPSPIHLQSGWQSGAWVDSICNMKVALDQLWKVCMTLARQEEGEAHRERHAVFQTYLSFNLSLRCLSLEALAFAAVAASGRSVWSFWVLRSRLRAVPFDSSPFSDKPSLQPTKYQSCWLQSLQSQALLRSAGQELEEGKRNGGSPENITRNIFGLTPTGATGARRLNHPFPSNKSRIIQVDSHRGLTLFLTALGLLWLLIAFSFLDGGLFFLSKLSAAWWMSSRSAWVE